MPDARSDEPPRPSEDTPPVAPPVTDPAPRPPPPPASAPPMPPAAPPGSGPPRAAPVDDADLRPVTATAPTAVRDREPILDLLRGFAIFGILLVNVEFMRGADFYDVLTGRPVPVDGADAVVSFVVGWLVAGKFVSSFSLLFGIGAGFLVARAIRDGVPPRRLLARRYTLLLGFGLAHMILLFPGDVLFVYAVTGFVLLAFVPVRPKVAVWWSGGILAALTLLSAGFAVLGALFADDAAAAAAGQDPFTAAFEAFVDDRRVAAIEAYTGGGLGEVLVARGFEAAIIQSGQLILLPWFLALFLLGFALSRTGVVTALGEHRPLLRRTALIGLGLGLPLNLPLAFAGTLGAAAGGTDAASMGVMDLAAVPAQMIGAPLLAAGYLAAITLLCQRVGTFGPLSAVGRMALSAYLFQSLAATVVFVGFSRYDAWSATQALGFVVATWAVLLVICPLWLQAFRFGPVEWLWRSWTYRRWQPLRNTTGGQPAASA